ncbi:hypothetical protein ACS0TY_016769 [Phlomoides rotata]
MTHTDRDFGDVEIVPLMDRYELVVLKTVAISEYGEWPEEIYNPFANGARYILSSDIAKFIISQHANHSLQRFIHEICLQGEPRLERHQISAVASLKLEVDSVGFFGPQLEDFPQVLSPLPGLPPSRDCDPRIPLQ